MSPLRIMLAEIRFRKLTFLLSVLAVTVAAALLVVAPSVVEAYQRQTALELGASAELIKQEEAAVAQMRAEMESFERDTEEQLRKLEDQTRRLMRDMGFNLMIVHKDTNMADFWAADFAVHDMPQEYVYRLANDKRLTLIAHLVATLQQKIQWQGRKVLLVGYLPEVPQPHLRQKSPMGYHIKPGTVLLGCELGCQHKPGESIEVLGQQFTIAEIWPERGSKDDITIAMHLEDAQRLLGKDNPPRINQILALGCTCDKERLPGIRQQLEQVLPDTRVTEFQSIAIARAEQRTAVEEKRKIVAANMQQNIAQREKLLEERKAILADMEASRARTQRIVEMLALIMTPLVLLAAGLWVGLLAMANVRERRTEIGLLRALGKSSTLIASLLLGKAILVGLLGAIAGVGLGALVARWVATTVLGVPGDDLGLSLAMLAAPLVGAPLLSAAASYLPTLAALSQDPAIVLRDQ